MTAAAFNANSLAPAWNAFQSALPVRLASIHSKAEYERVVAFMNQLLDVVGDDESHELADLL
jgi:HTH-type transcriptional regulator/antitoxin HigA